MAYDKSQNYFSVLYLNTYNNRCVYAFIFVLLLKLHILFHISKSADFIVSTLLILHMFLSLQTYLCSFKFSYGLCTITHFVYGSLQEVVQQVSCFSQRAGADHHRGVHRVQLILQENTVLGITTCHFSQLDSKHYRVCVYVNTLVSSICTMVAWHSDRLSLM